MSQDKKLHYKTTKALRLKRRKEALINSGLYDTGRDRSRSDTYL